MLKFNIESLDICAVKASAARICYLLYPLEGLEEWVAAAAKKYDVSIVLITGMDWDDDLTPWPAPGEPPGAVDFKGKASTFRNTLLNKVLPEAERRLEMNQNCERTLGGVSLSGLFTLWQWLNTDTFQNIISLSGSFWYPGFADYVLSCRVSKSGRAYFLLGDKEANSRVNAFRSVQNDTDRIVAYLRTQGVDLTFSMVPGNHYQHSLERLTLAFTWMFGKT